MPATAAIDNETLDHLLSVVSGSCKVRQIRPLSKPCRRGIVRAGMQRAAQPFQRQRRRGLTQKLPHHLDRIGAMLLIVGARKKRRAERVLGPADPF